MNKGPQHLSLWPREHVSGACAPTSLYLCVWCVLVCVLYVVCACEHECWTCKYKCVLGTWVSHVCMYVSTLLDMYFCMCARQICVHICVRRVACVLHVRGLKLHTQTGKVGTARDDGGHGGDVVNVGLHLAG